MKLEQQVVSLELAKRLKELGVKQESLWYHRSPTPSHGRDWWNISTCEDSHATENYSAFTVAELGEILPKDLGKDYSFAAWHMPDGCWFVDYVGMPVEINNKPFTWGDEFRRTVYQNGDTEAEARAKMLIYLLENKLINLIK